MLFVFYKMNSKVHTAPLRLQRDIDELFKEGRSLGRTGRDMSVVSGKYLLRELPEANAPVILYLYHAPKKYIKPAHERNKLKRWMREAVRISEEMNAINNVLSEKNMQMMLLLRITTPPSEKCNWQHITDDIRSIAGKLRNVTS
jgi:ribonuclease P protein component